MAKRVVSSTYGDDTCTGTWSNSAGRFTHTWTISTDVTPGVRMESSKFSPEADANITWFLEVRPGTDASFGPPDADIILHCTTRNGRTVTGNFAISASSGYPEYIGQAVKKHQIFTPNKPECQLLLKSFLLYFGIQGSITIICEMLFVDNTIQDEALKSRMNKDYEQLFMSEDFSDITLTVGDKAIPAHKTVLAARSPVFFAMFKHNMKELKTNCVKIDDIDHEVVLETLRFIYTDEAPNLDQMAIKLLVAADKYGLERLKVMCSQALQKSLSVENSPDIWLLSHLHNEGALKVAAVNFICENIKTAIQTTSFKSMADSYTEFMMEIVHVLSTKLK